MHALRPIHGYTLEELIAAFGESALPAYRARQVFRWVFRGDAAEFGQMSDIPADVRTLLAAQWSLALPTERARACSTDGTVKFLLGLADGNAVEAVLIPARGRVTGCLSTQVGCRYACTFCASGAGGLVRDLTAAEIVEEALFLRRQAQGGLTHLVFMGTGEPLDNYDHVMKAVRILNDPHGKPVGARRITISTSGLVPGIRRLSRQGLQIELSVSLHAADDRLRSRLMPVNKKYPLPELIRACKDYYKATNRQVTFEYILLPGVNTAAEQIERLGRLLAGMDAKVNLIACNPVGRKVAQAVDKSIVRQFKQVLGKKGIVVTERLSRGSDIDAACGQLRLKMPRVGVEPT